MKMNKMFAGLIAFVAGVALSAGSAFATKGYTTSDPAGMKLVPLYETGGMLFTAIGIQNMSMRADSTRTLHTAVTTAQTALDDADPTTLTGAAYAALEKALADAKMAAYMEHVVVNVMVYDAMGMMMAETSLCMGENQFGYVVITESGDAMSIPNRGMVLSMVDDEIPAYGYVTVKAGNKFTGCTFGATAVAIAADPTTDTSTAEIAAWTILQDVGTGFFGTEIPTSTITMGTDEAATTTMDESMMISCYGDPTTATNAVGGARAGAFNATTFRCGLMPERHTFTLTTDTPPAIDTASSPRGMVTTRFDVAEGTENDIFVWLAAGGDTDMTTYADRRMLEVMTYCEDGTMAMVPDMTPGAAEGAMVGMAMVPAPTMLTMIDPMGEMLMPFTEQCMDAGSRGVLKFKMPAGSYAGLAWTHISQRMSNFRMNMPGYNMANDDTCTNIATDTGGDAAEICM